MDVPGNGQLLLHDLELHIPQGDVAPENLEDVGIIGGQRHLLLQAEDVVLRDGDLGQLQGHAAVFHLFVPVDGDGGLLVGVQKLRVEAGPGGLRLRVPDLQENQIWRGFQRQIALLVLLVRSHHQAEVFPGPDFFHNIQNTPLRQVPDLLTGKRSPARHLYFDSLRQGRNLPFFDDFFHSKLLNSPG